MTYVPEFMLRYAEFDAERTRVRTLDEWIAFRRKWFDPAQWPRKSARQLGAEAMAGRGVLDLGGRAWSRTQYVYDITPEARYELFATVANTGDPIRFPHTGGPGDATQSGRAYECPFCEISTRERGGRTCPQCGRLLLARAPAD